MVGPIENKMAPEISSQPQRTAAVPAGSREKGSAAASAGNESPPVSPEQAREAADAANRLADVMTPKLRFNYDDDLEMVIVKVLDGETDEVIRQIPPKEMIALAERLRDMRDKGVLLREKV